MVLHLKGRGLPKRLHELECFLASESFCTSPNDTACVEADDWPTTFAAGHVHALPMKKHGIEGHVFVLFNVKVTGDLRADAARRPS